MSDSSIEAAERITLTIPGEPRFIGIARLFVGGDRYSAALAQVAARAQVSAATSAASAGMQAR